MKTLDDTVVSTLPNYRDMPTRSAPNFPRAVLPPNLVYVPYSDTYGQPIPAKRT